MIGLINKVLVDMVIKSSGEKTLKKIFAKAHIDEQRIYAINLPYPDDEWQALFRATIETLGLTEDEAYTAYADAFFSYVIAAFPVWFAMANSSLDFLKLQPKIHNGFYSGLTKAEDKRQAYDKFSLEDKGNTVIVHYRSKNKHCQLYIALAAWLARYYNDRLAITETHCMLNGDSECTLVIEWSAA